MGSYVSKTECPALGINLDCSITIDKLTNETTAIGGVSKGDIPPNGDIAGIGVVSVFIAVTSLALVLSSLDFLWSAVFKPLGWKKRRTEQDRLLREQEGRDGFSFSGLCEAVVLSCSDQQIFTGGAYALCLRYAQGCHITAYHYNIVANMLLLTCATHLMSITIVRDYWRYPWLACLRIILTALVFLVTGMVLANQNANSDAFPFPSRLPPWDDKTGLMFRNAACFQDSQGQLQVTLGVTFQNSDQFKNSIFDSKPGNTIQGWNFYIITLLWYAAALIVELVRFLRRGRNVPGFRKQVADFFRTTRIAKPFQNGWGSRATFFLFSLYLLGGIVISGVTVGFSATYIVTLRRWARASQWLESDFTGNLTGINSATRLSDEDDPTAFGQMVPVLLTLLTVFAFAEKWSEMASSERANRKYTISSNITPGSMSRANTFQNGPSGSNMALAGKTPNVYESQIGMAMTPGMSMTPGMTPMTPGFPGMGMGLALDGTNQSFVQSTPGISPYGSSQVRFAGGTGSTPLMAGMPTGYVPTTTAGSVYSTTTGSSVVNGNGSVYFMNPSGTIGVAPLRQNSNISAATTLYPATTPGPIVQQPHVVVPAQHPQQHQHQHPQVMMPGQPMSTTGPSANSSVVSTAPPVGVPASMLQQQHQHRQPAYSHQKAHSTTSLHHMHSAQNLHQQHQVYRHPRHPSADGYFPPQGSTASLQGVQRRAT